MDGRIIINKRQMEGHMSVTITNRVAEAKKHLLDVATQVLKENQSSFKVEAGGYTRGCGKLSDKLVIDIDSRDTQRLEEVKAALVAFAHENGISHIVPYAPSHNQITECQIRMDDGLQNVVRILVEKLKDAGINVSQEKTSGRAIG
jgi:hypothetical protein